MSASLRRLSLSLAALLLVGLASAQNARFDEGVQAYQSGDLDGAIEAFKEVLANNPGDEEAYRMLDTVEDRVMLDMLLERGELGQLAERFLKKATLGHATVAADPSGASDVVDRLMDGDEVERQRALTELQATYRSWAVPALVGPLGDASDVDRRVIAIQALRHLGSDAVMPLIAVTGADDDLTRRNAASVLGSLGDPRAAPALAWMATNDADPVTAQLASEALNRVGAGGGDPAGLSQALALRYFNGEPAVVAAYEAPSVVWEWVDRKLQGRAVLGGLYRFEVAEQFALLALENGAGNEARPLLAAIHAAMKAEITEAQRLPEMDGNALLEEAAAGLADLDVNLALAGSARGVGLSLCLSGDGRNVPAAQAMMAAMNGSPAEMTALRAALGDSDGTVAFGASMALARHGVSEPSVVGTLSGALASLPARLAISIGDTGLSGEAPGWALLSSTTVADGLLRAKMFPPKDVVVLREGLQGVTLDAMVYGLRGDPRTAAVPIIVVTNDTDQIESLYGDVVSKVVTRAGWDDVAEVAGDRTDVQQRALARAGHAAEVLAGLTADAVRGIGTQVGAALSAGADDGVKLAVLRLVAHAGLTDALSQTEALFDDASDDVRIAAMNAAASIYARNGGASSAEAALALLDAAAEDGEVAQAAAAALGQLGGIAALDLRRAVR